MLSGRHTEWEFERDLSRLAKALPIPEPEEPQPELRTLIRRLLRNEKRPEPPAKEEPLIVLMAPLDEGQIRRYSTTKGINDVEQFLAALGRANMLETARRPGDLNWLVGYWRSNCRLGTFAKMVAEGLREQIQEADNDRSRHDQLSSEKAMRGPRAGWRRYRVRPSSDNRDS